MFYMIPKQHKENKLAETKTHQDQFFPLYYINNHLLHIIEYLRKHCIQRMYCRELENKFYNSEQTLFRKMKNVDDYFLLINM